MFSPVVIERKVKKLYLTQNIKLVRHPIGDSVRMYNHFLDLEQTDGASVWYQREGQTREEFALAPKEIEFIRNEMLMSAISFPYWYYRYFFIAPKEGGTPIRPEVQIAQSIFLDILADLDEKNLPKLILALKGRQLGISTITEGIILWHDLFRKGIKSVISSAEQEKSEQLSGMIDVGIESLPQWMKPVIDRDNIKEGKIFGGGLDNTLLIQHGAMTKGIARGNTPQIAHISEVSHYPNPVVSIESSLLKAMHENAHTFIVLESTPRKRDDWFHGYWKFNKEGMKTGNNRFVCMFLPWFCGIDKYPTKDWLRNHPPPREWVPKRETVEQAAKAALYVASTALLRKHFGEGWTMPIHQQWFWEFSFVEASRDEASFRSWMSEMAADDETCFVSKNWSVYSRETIASIRAGLSPTWTDYAFSGSGIEPRYHLTSWHDPKAPTEKVQWKTIEDQDRTWTFTPLREEPDDTFYLRVWEKPVRGYNYTVGVDPSGGGGRDNASIDVLRVGRNGEPDVQVAQFYCPNISPSELPPFVQAVSLWYGRWMEPMAEAYLAPETQVNLGDPITWQLQKEGYTNFHRNRRYDTVDKGASNRLGWVTSYTSRQLMLDAQKLAIESGWLHVNSERTLDELEGQEGEETEAGKTRFDHSSSTHDDSIFSLGIAYFVSHDEETLSMRQSGRRPIEPLKLAPKEAPARLSGLALMQFQFRMDEKSAHRVWADEGDSEGEFVY